MAVRDNDTHGICFEMFWILDVMLQVLSFFDLRFGGSGVQIMKTLNPEPVDDPLLPPHRHQFNRCNN